MSAQNVLTDRRGAVLEVTLNRPKANAIDMATSQELGEIFTAFRDDPELRVAIVTGAGEKFFAPVGISRPQPTARRRMRITARAALAVCKNCAG